MMRQRCQHHLPELRALLPPRFAVRLRPWWNGCCQPCELVQITGRAAARKTPRR